MYLRHDYVLSQYVDMEEELEEREMNVLRQKALNTLPQKVSYPVMESLCTVYTVYVAKIPGVYV